MLYLLNNKSMTDTLSNTSTYSNSICNEKSEEFSFLNAKRKRECFDFVMKKFKEDLSYQMGNKSFLLKKEKGSFSIEINHTDDKGSETESENDEDAYNRMNYDYNYFLQHKSMINQRNTIKRKTIVIPIYDHNKKQNFLINQNKAFQNNQKLVNQFLKAKKHMWQFTKNKCSLSFDAEVTEEDHTNPFEINFDLSTFENSNKIYDSDNSNLEQGSIIYD